MFYKLRQSTWTKRAALIVVAALAVTLISACGKSSKTLSHEFKDVQKGAVVATYNGGTVTDLEFNKFKGIYSINRPEVESLLELKQFQEMLLEQYIGYKLLASKATDEELKTANEAANTQLKNYKEYIKSDKTAADNAKTKGITENDMGTFFYLTSTINAYIENQVTKENVQTEYEKNKPDYTVSDVRHILVSLEVKDPKTGEVTLTRTEAEALAIAKEAEAKLKAGEDWATVAEKYSDDPGSKDNGGLYEDYPGGTWAEEFKQAIFVQPIDEIGAPILTKFGYHVIQVVKRDIKEFADLDESMNATIRNILSNKFIESFMTDELPTYSVEMTLPDPEVSAPENTETPSETPTENPSEQQTDEKADQTKTKE